MSVEIIRCRFRRKLRKYTDSPFNVRKSYSDEEKELFYKEYWDVSDRFNNILLKYGVFDEFDLNDFGVSQDNHLDRTIPFAIYNENVIHLAFLREIYSFLFVVPHDYRLMISVEVDGDKTYTMVVYKDIIAHDLSLYLCRKFEIYGLSRIDFKLEE